MAQRKINIDRPEISSEEILKTKNFESVFSNYSKILHKPFYKSTWFFSSLVGVAAFSGVVYMKSNITLEKMPKNFTVQASTIISEEYKSELHIHHKKNTVTTFKMDNNDSPPIEKKEVENNITDRNASLNESNLPENNNLVKLKIEKIRKSSLSDEEKGVAITNQPFDNRIFQETASASDDLTLSVRETTISTEAKEISDIQASSEIVDVVYTNLDTLSDSIAQETESALTLPDIESPADSNSNSIDDKKHTVSISPFHFMYGTFQLGYEKKLSEARAMFATSGITIIKQENYLESTNIGVNGEFQYRFYKSLFKPESKISGKLRPKIYTAPYLFARYNHFKASEQELVGFNSDTGVFEKKDATYRDNIFSVGGGVVVGSQIMLWKIISVNGYIGGGIKATSIKPQTKQYCFYEAQEGSPDYSGVYFKAGLHIGLSF